MQIKVFRVPAGKRILAQEQDFLEKNGWYIIDIRQSKIFGKKLDNRWFGDWLLRAVPKSCFFALDSHEQHRIVMSKPRYKYNNFGAN